MTTSTGMALTAVDRIKQYLLERRRSLDEHAASTRSNETARLCLECRSLEVRRVLLEIARIEKGAPND